MSTVPDYQKANPSFNKPDIAAKTARDFGETAEQLARIVSRVCAGGQPVTVRDLKTPVGAGASNETILFFADWQGEDGPVSRGLVLRVGPSAFQLFMDPRMKDQYRLLRSFHASGRVKVAEPLCFVEDSDPFGAPFMLMERLAGQVPVSFPPYNAEGFLCEATVAQRRTLWESAMDQLIRIATTPVAEVAFLAEADGDGGFAEQFGWWRQASRWSGVAHIPVIAKTEDWLLAHQPPNPPPGLSWGDARIGNMMFAADFTVAGVMDWEQVGLGGALLDLGWWLYFDRFHSEALGLTRLEGLGGREETIARWQEGTGIAVRDLLWYEIFAGWKVSILTARKMLLEESAPAPRNNCSNNIITQLNARLLAWPEPVDAL